ncbi:ComF family protein [Gracilimonas mengyeensis]|uniref:ComF family protein n=1 Tax=Gracilimonas mengyeensis TaxID=1302730 RepID=A0A521FLK3_9BACT|nr:ComF family protein [Gracilimonas mengyeensis]SMO97055.1 comF family protein [Gracilimonas mengyeensis]
MKSLVKKIKEGISEVIFPTICVVCGMKVSASQHFVCTHCLEHKFDLANRQGKQISSDTILPEGIVLQHALWNFDKGGHLQDLLHQLKYNRLTGVGVDLGRQLGKTLLRNPFFIRAIEDQKVRLVPVPLHPKKEQKRGYNQAFYVTRGVAEVTNLHILKKQAIKRVKNTRTQTGFSLEKRRENINGAFKVQRPDLIEEAFCVIIDDVFTTGATTFELAKALRSAGSGNIAIASVAQA